MEKLAAHSIFAHMSSSTTKRGKFLGGHVFEMNVLNTKKPREGIESGPKSH